MPARLGRRDGCSGGGALELRGVTGRHVLRRQFGASLVHGVRVAAAAPFFHCFFVTFEQVRVAASGQRAAPKQRDNLLEVCENNRRNRAVD